MNTKVQDFKISKDETPSTIVQRDVKLFPYVNGEYIAVWKDYRNGVESKFAQRLNSIGEKLGENFEVEWDEIVQLQNGTSIAIIKNILGCGDISCEYEQTGQIIYSDYSLGNLFDMNWGDELHDEEIVHNFYLSNKNGFLRLFEMAGCVYKSSFSSIGENFSFEEICFADSYYYRNLEFACLESGEYIFVYLDENTNEEPELHADFYNSVDSLILENVVINKFQKDNINFKDYFYKVTRSNNSSFVVIELNTELMTLDTYQYSTDALFISGDNQSIKNLNSPDWRRLINFSEIISIDKFPTFLITVQQYVDNRLEYHSFMLKINSDGEIININKLENDITFDISDILYQVNNEKVLFTLTENNDVFLCNLNDESFGKNRLSDDSVGSQEFWPNVKNAGENQFLVSYRNSQDRFEMINDDAELIDSDLSVINRSSLFLSDGSIVNTWEKADDEYKYTGYSIYNSQNQLININKIDSVSLDNHINHSAFITSSDRIVYASFSDNKKNIQLIRKDGTIDNELNIANNIFSNHINLMYSDEEHFWLRSDNNYQKFTLALTPLTDVISFDSDFYIGKDLFVDRIESPQLLGIYTEYSYWIFDGNLPENRTKIDGIKSSFYTSFIRLNENETGILESYNNKIYCYSYSLKSNEILKKTLIHDNVGSIKTNPSAAINGNKVMFVWQDNRNAGLGFDIYGSIFNLDEITDIGHDKKNDVNELPTEFALEQNYPNPFNPSTTIKYEIPAQNIAGMTNLVQLIVYDVLGNEITTLVNEYQSQGSYSVEFDASSLPSGVYFYRLNFGDKSITNKMLLLK